MVSPIVRLGSTHHVGEASPLENRDPVAGLSERDAIANLDRDGYNRPPAKV